jgi:hypothetical protein
MLPLLERKRRLRALISSECESSVLYVDHIDGAGVGAENKGLWPILISSVMGVDSSRLTIAFDLNIFGPHGKTQNG